MAEIQGAAYVAALLCYVSNVCQGFEVILGNIRLPGNKVISRLLLHPQTCRGVSLLGATIASYANEGATILHLKESVLTFNKFNDDRRILSHVLWLADVQRRIASLYRVVVITLQYCVITSESSFCTALPCAYSSLPAGLPLDRGIANHKPLYVVYVPNAQLSNTC